MAREDTVTSISESLNRKVLHRSDHGPGGHLPFETGFTKRGDLAPRKCTCSVEGLLRNFKISANFHSHSLAHSRKPRQDIPHRSYPVSKNKKGLSFSATAGHTKRAYRKSIFCCYQSYQKKTSASANLVLPGQSKL